MKLSRIWRTTFGLVGTAALAFVLVTIGIGISAVKLTHEALELQLDERVATETSALLIVAGESGLPGLADAIRLRESAHTPSSLLYLLLDSEGQQLAGSVVPVRPVHRGYEEHFEYRLGEQIGVAQAMATSLEAGLLVVAADRSELFGIDRQLTRLFIAALAIMLIAGIGSASLIGLATRRRLARIETTARTIMNGEFEHRIPVDGSGSEFDRLAGVLNQMLNRIGGLIGNLRQVSSDVAHDLRTPLTRLRHHLDLAIAEPESQARLRHIGAARDQSGELLEIFSALLRIAEIEGMAERLPWQRQDLSLLVEQMAESYRPAMDDSGYGLDLKVEPGLEVVGDRHLLSQALANLLDNVLRHTPSGTQVTLAAEREADTIRVSVTDNGPGVDEAELGRLFQRFSRSERSRSTPGHGLGLSLVAAVATAHGGDAKAHTCGGFTVILTLPAAGGPSSGLPQQRDTQP